MPSYTGTSGTKPGTVPARGGTEAVTIIPAEPGWFAVFWDEGTGNLYAEDAVIAWMIQQDATYDGHVEVIVQPLGRLGSFQFEDDYCALLRPDGKVEAVRLFSGVYQNIDDAIDAAQEAYRHRLILSSETPGESPPKPFD